MKSTASSRSAVIVTEEIIASHVSKLFVAIDPKMLSQLVDTITLSTSLATDSAHSSSSSSPPRHPANAAASILVVIIIAIIFLLFIVIHTLRAFARKCNTYRLYCLFNLYTLIKNSA